jgi:hypothetical protein
MGYPDGGGLTAEERTRRERVRLAMGDADVADRWRRAALAETSRCCCCRGSLPRLLSAWEVSSAIRGLRAETRIWGLLARLATSDRESPPGLTRSGTQRAR